MTHTNAYYVSFSLLNTIIQNCNYFISCFQVHDKSLVCFLFVFLQVFKSKTYLGVQRLFFVSIHFLQLEIISNS